MGVPIKLKDDVAAVEFDRNNPHPEVEHSTYSQNDASGIYEFDRYTLNGVKIEHGDWILMLPDERMILKRHDAEDFFEFLGK